MRKVIVHTWMTLDGWHRHPAPEEDPGGGLATAAGTCATSTTAPEPGWSSSSPQQASHPPGPFD
jgi:hypothetical protein